MTFEEIKKRLSEKVVGIAGAGGLGSNCAVALARVGIGKLIVADFDVVSESNLNRQYYFRNQIGIKKVDALKENLLAINHDTEVEENDIKLDPDSVLRLFKDCDVVVEAFDLAEMKQMIIETILGELPEKPLVTGVGMAGVGDNNSIGVRKEGNLYMCGDGKSEISGENPPLAPRVGIVANMQANVVLEILLGR